MGVLRFVFHRAIELSMIVLIIVLVPNLPPKANFSKSISVKPAQPFTGTLALNNKLDGVELWHKGDFVGPECFADFNGELYTSLLSGDIVKLTDNHITPVVKFGKPCKNPYEESICGRPLGFEFSQDGFLYAADSYYGIFRVDVKTGKKEQLVSPQTEIEGKKPKTFNSVALASSGDLYWTDSSTEFTLEDGIFTILADPSGRLIHYDPKTKRNRVLIDGIHFANGVALSDDEEFIIVAETVGSRLLRYYLKGPKKGTTDVFIDGLPGLPDNLKADGKGGFLVPLVLARDADHPALFQSILPFPWLRKTVARLMGITEYLFKKIDQYYPNEVSLRVVYYIGHFTSSPKILSFPRVSLLRVNRKGEITHSAHTVNNKISSISEMHIFRDSLYLGSPWNDYIARIPLAKLGWEDLKKEERVKREVPPTTTPKPTTTTPKPTTTTSTPTTTTPRPTTTPPPETTTQKATTTTQKPTTTTTTQKPTTAAPTQTPTPTPKQQTTPPPAKQQQAQRKPAASAETKAPPVKQAPPTTTQAPPKQAPPAQTPPTPARTESTKQAPTTAKPQTAQRKQN